MTGTPPGAVPWHRILRDFARIGLTSFGGGSATLIAMRRLCVHDRGWMTEEEYVESFVTSRLTPGINIIAQVIIIGRKIGGWSGAVAGVAGLMFPALVITLLLCLAYEYLRSVPGTAAPLAGMSAAVAGFTLVLAIEMTRGMLSKRSLVVDLLLLLAYLAAAALGANPLLIIVISLAVGVLFPRLLGTKTAGEGDSDDT